MFRENLAHASRRGISESVRWVRRLGCRAFARRYASPRFGFLFGVSHSRRGASAAWWEIIFGGSTSHRHRERMLIDRRRSLSSGAGEACSAYAACETQIISRALGRCSQTFIDPRCGSSVQQLWSVTGQSPCGVGRLTTRSRQQPIALRSSFLFDWDYSVCRRGSPPKAVPQL